MPFGDFDFAKMFEMPKQMGDFKFAPVDMEGVVATQRKNIEALAQANQLAVESMQAIARRQSEIFRSMMEEASSAMREVMAAGSPEEKAARQTEIVKDVPIDVGVLQYSSPGSYPDGYTRPHTTEGYAQIGYGPVSFKYSHAFSNLFGFADSHHSQYFDLSGNFDTGFWGLTLNLHVGYQQVPHQVVRTSYADWKVGVTKDFGSGWTASLSYIDTNASRLAYTNTRGSYMGKATALLAVTKTF